MGQLGPVCDQFFAVGFCLVTALAAVHQVLWPAPLTGCARIAGNIPVRARTRPQIFGADMSKRARKRRSRKGNAANHGRKPNA